MKLIKASLIDEKPLEWLWLGRIPIGQITLLEGDPGTAKSTLTVAMAAIVSTGQAWPDGAACVRGEVIIANAEDPEEEVIKPRLVAAGADVERVFCICPSEHDAQVFTIPDHVAALEDLVRKRSVRLIVFDPLEAFLSGSVDNYRNHHIRRALKSLELMAKRTGCAVVIVRHLVKDATKAALYRGSGSIGIIGAARAALSVGRDKTDKDRCIVVPAKSNWSKLQPGIAYKVEEVSYVTEDGTAITTSRIRWDGVVHITADDLLTVVDGQASGAGTDSATRAFIEAELAAGATSSAKLLATALKAGIKKADVFRVSKLMDIRRYKDGLDGTGEWMWELPVKVEAANWANEDWSKEIG